MLSEISHYLLRFKSVVYLLLFHIAMSHPVVLTAMVPIRKKTSWQCQPSVREVISISAPPECCSLMENYRQMFPFWYLIWKPSLTRVGHDWCCDKVPALKSAPMALVYLVLMDLEFHWRLRQSRSTKRLKHALYRNYENVREHSRSFSLCIDSWTRQPSPRLMLLSACIYDIHLPELLLLFGILN